MSKKWTDGDEKTRKNADRKGNGMKKLGKWA